LNAPNEYFFVHVAERNLKCDDKIQLAKHPKVFETIYDAIGKMLSTKLRIATSVLGHVDSLQICLDDGTSWRASLSLPKTPGNGDSGIVYKSHRHDVEDKELMNARWRLNQWYLEAVNTIAELNSFIVHGIQGVEADDIMTIKGKQLADQGDYVVTMSHDYDNTQSVYSNVFNGGCVINCYIGQYGNPDKWFIDHPTQERLGSLSIFGNDFLKTLGPMGANLTTANVLAKQYMLFEKIMRGDVSDGISPLMIRVTQDKNGKNREYALAPAAIPKIIEGIGGRKGRHFLTYDDLYDDAQIELFINDVHESVHKHILDVNDEVQKEWFQFYIDKYKFNRKLICCNLVELGDSMVNAIHGLTSESSMPQTNVAPYHIVKQLKL
jgi:hypothetical protein